MVIPQRGRKECSGRKVSDVEAAYVIESYLTELNYTKTLSAFREEAASVFSLVTKAPKAVKSLNDILQEFLALREEKQRSVREKTNIEQEKSRMEQALKDEKVNAFQERNRVNLFIQQIHESLVCYQSSVMSQTSPAGPVMMGTPAQHIPTMPYGHSTPPEAGIGPGLTRTPGSGRALNIAPATNKRKIAVRSQTIPGVSLATDNTTQTAASTKKARPHILPPDSPSGPGLVQPSPTPSWPLCGTVRKNSLNTMRILQPNPPPRRLLPIPPRNVKSVQSNPPLSDPQASIDLGSPVPSSRSSPACIQAQPSGQTRSQDEDLVDSTRNINTETEDSPDPRTPLRTSASQSPAHVLDRSFVDGTLSQPQAEDAGENRRVLPKSTNDPKDSVENGHPSSSQIQPCEGCLQNKKNRESTETSSRGRTSPDSCTCASSTRGMKPSKTMRPLDFGGTSQATEGPSLIIPVDSLNHVSPSESHESLAGTTSPGKGFSPAHSSDDLGDLREDDTLAHVSEDLESIDDILACLDDSSFSELVGNMLSSDLCGAGTLPSTGNGDDISFIGEDTFGFHSLGDNVNSDRRSPQRENVLVERDVNLLPNDVSPVKSSNLSSSPSKSCPPPPAVEEKSRRSPNKENELTAKQ